MAETCTHQEMEAGSYEDNSNLLKGIQSLTDDPVKIKLLLDLFIEIDSEESKQNDTGVKSMGYIAATDRILKSCKSNPYERVGGIRELLYRVTTHLNKSADVEDKEEFGNAKHMVQIVNTLFEAAAAVANLTQARSKDEGITLSLLKNHAMRGLELIGADEADEAEDDDF